jgi:hypothetical protein
VTKYGCNSLKYIISQGGKKPFRKIYQTKNLPDSDPDLTSSSLVKFGPKFEYIVLHIQSFTV